MTENRRLNVVVLGETTVGKSSLLLRFVKNTFSELTAYTVAVDVLHTQININNQNVNLILWDTGGQERFRAMVNLYFRKADGVLLVYDVTSLVSFTELPRWLSELRKVNETAPVIVVGNKIDIANPKEKVEVENVKEFAVKNNLYFMEASARSGKNVGMIFERLTRKMLNMEEDEDNSKLTLTEKKEVKKGCCS